MERLLGKRWYSRLVAKPDMARSYSLMNQYSMNDLENRLVICFATTRYFEGRAERYFALFEDYIEFYQYYQTLPLTDRSFYEIIFGHLPQKPHFDIDIALETLQPGETLDQVGGKIIQGLIRAVRYLFSARELVLDLARHICIYSSHGPHKHSYHLIVNGYAHSSNIQARAFYDLVIQYLSLNDLAATPHYLRHIDRGVYSKIQQFRIVNCQKEGSNRPKVCHQGFQFEGQTIIHQYEETPEDNEVQNLMVLEESLISWTPNCRLLPDFAPPQPERDYLDLDIDDTTVEQAIKLMVEKLGEMPLSFKGVTNNCILFKREGPSHCPLCERNHEYENPFLSLIGDQVYWHCRRSKDKYLLGGITGSTTAIDLTPPPPPPPKISHGLPVVTRSSGLPPPEVIQTLDNLNVRPGQRTPIIKIPLLRKKPTTPAPSSRKNRPAIMSPEWVLRANQTGKDH